MSHSKSKKQPTFRRLKRTLWPTFIVAVVLLTLAGQTKLDAQQSNVPARISGSDTTFLGRVDSSVVDLLLEALPKQFDDTKGTVLESKLLQTKKILDGETVWLKANWPSVPTEITIAIAGNNRVNKLAKLWNVNAERLSFNKTHKVSLTSVEKIAEQLETKAGGSDVPVHDWQ